MSIRNLVFGLLALALLCTAVNLACVYGREPTVRAVTRADRHAAPPSKAEAGEPLLAPRVALVAEAPRIADDSTRAPAEESVDPFSPALRAYARAELQRGAGGSCAMYVRAAALTAVDCRFEGGYGRNPDGYANLLRAGSPLLARFEGCVLERVSLAEANQPSVAFVACVLTDMLDDIRPGAHFDGCQITVLPAEQRYDAAVRQRDLNELFPGWRERVQRR